MLWPRIAVLGVVAVAGCVVPDLLTDHACPCAPGWRCDEASDRCVQGGPVDGGPDAHAGDAGAGDAGEDAGVGDAGRETSDAAVPAARRCWRRPDGCSWDVSGFRFVEDTTSNLASVPSSGFMFSPDGCTVFFSAGGESRRLDRDEAGAPFGPATVIAELAGSGVATVSPSDLETIVSRNDPASGRTQLFRAVRSEASAPWGAPALASDLAVASAIGHFDPALAPSGLALYSSPGLASGQTLHVALRATLGVAFAPPEPIDLSGMGLSAAVTDAWRPTVTSDERVLVFGVVAARRELMYSTRSTQDTAWGRAQVVPAALFTSETLTSGLAVSPDGCELAVRTGRTVHLVFVDP